MEFCGFISISDDLIIIYVLWFVGNVNFLLREIY